MFVSHSSHTPDALDRLEALVKSLRAGKNGVDVLYDKEQIETGARWREVIHAMLAECDAAIILVTPDSLQSPWVLKEATILRWRHDRDTNFQIFVSADVDTGELKKNRMWDPIDLPEIQFLTRDSVAGIATSVKKRLARLAAQLRPTPLDLLAEEITGLLTKAHPKHLEMALNALNEQVPFEVSDQRQHLAYAFARWILRQSPPALERMAITLKLLGKTFPVKNSRQILNLVAPMWVELDAASWFVRAHWRRPELRDVAISCKLPTQTLQQYVDRAYVPSDPPRVWLLNGVTGGAHSEDIAQELHAVLRRPVKEVLGRQPSDADIDDFLTKTPARLYVALRLPDDRQVVTTLQDRYRHVTFVFFMDPEVYLNDYNDEAASVATGVGWVAPSLDPRLEENVSDDYTNARARLVFG